MKSCLKRKSYARLARETGFSCIIAKGSPSSDGGLYLYYLEYPDEGGPPLPSPDDEYFLCDDRRDEDVYGLYSIETRHAFIAIQRGKVTDHDHYPIVRSATAAGYEAAAGARFEHGESGYRG